ncbi:pentatricopeptide repeat-containing protein At2g13600-like [Momordica charantia]|uniref:Pentatricopeptide repeat-containing protein At2g13600-like n=1 Tax=Momordica charantia TaxID=3673 RepID=A0A6J1E1T7_MOMCH|nr:pentatricopeptide repeat-containing protein At2g13600-like [Momordica charantia]
MARNGLIKHLTSDFLFLDSSYFAKLLNQCTSSKSARDTSCVHACIIKLPFASETFIQNRLIDVYGKCGCVDVARKLFDGLLERNIFSWNSIICAYTKFGFLDDAVDIFERMPEVDQCSWNSMISGFEQHDRFDEALNYFAQMHSHGFLMNEYSFGSALSACAGLRDFKLGSQIHSLIYRSNYLSDVYMGSALVDMYSKCGRVDCARSVFDGMTVRSRVSWNSLITCYEQNGPVDEALVIFFEMIKCRVEADEVTLASVVSACATISAINEGQQIHARVVKCDEFRNDLILGNALVDMYAKCNRINKARIVFDRMPIRSVVSETSMVSGYAKASSVKAARCMFSNMMVKDVITWNALIAGCTQNGENEEALILFRLLKRESVWPTHYTFGNLLNACANLADLQLGRQAHSHVLKHGFRFQSGEESDIFVGNSLIDMYMKCGSVENGCKVFEHMVQRDCVSWNAMIVGYAQNGFGNEALGVFSKMLELGEKPDHVTMIGVLCACSHAGLLDEGRHYFQSMSAQHGLVSLKDHYTCMVDLLGRAGCLEEAKDLIEEMPMQPDAVIWGSLLAACKVHRNIKLGEYVVEKLLEVDAETSGPYVLLSNMYAERGDWGNVVRIRKLMRKRGVVKHPGCSWIEIQGQLNVFMVKDKKHPKKKEIYTLLRTLLKQMRRVGYVPYVVSNEIDEEEMKEHDNVLVLPN